MSDTVSLNLSVLSNNDNSPYNDRNFYIFIYRSFFTETSHSIPTNDSEFNSFLEFLYQTFSINYAQLLEQAFSKGLAFGFITHRLLKHPLLPQMYTNNCTYFCFCDFDYEAFDVKLNTINEFFLLFNKLLCFVFQKLTFKFKDTLASIINNNRALFSETLENLADDELWVALNDQSYSYDLYIHFPPHYYSLNAALYVYWLYLFQNNFDQFLYFADTLVIARQYKLLLELPTPKLYSLNIFSKFYQSNYKSDYVFCLRSFYFLPYYCDFLYNEIDYLLSLLPQRSHLSYNKMPKPFLRSAESNFKDLNNCFLHDFSDFYKPFCPNYINEHHNSSRFLDPFNDGLSSVFSSKFQVYINWRVIYEAIVFARSQNLLDIINSDFSTLDLTNVPGFYYNDLYSLLSNGSKKDENFLEFKSEESSSYNEISQFPNTSEYQSMEVENDIFFANDNNFNDKITNTNIPNSSLATSENLYQSIQPSVVFPIRSFEMNKISINNENHFQIHSSNFNINYPNSLLVNRDNFNSFSSFNNQNILSQPQVLNNVITQVNSSSPELNLHFYNQQENKQKSSTNFCQTIRHSNPVKFSSQAYSSNNNCSSKEYSDYKTLYHHKKSLSQTSIQLNSQKKNIIFNSLAEDFLFTISFGLYRIFKERSKQLFCDRKNSIKTTRQRSKSFNSIRPNIFPLPQ